MNEQLQLDFDKIIKTLKISEKEIQLKKSFLKKFIKTGFPNRKQEDWKFLDISQIIKKNISDLSFFNDYSLPNKIDPSISVNLAWAAACIGWQSEDKMMRYLSMYFMCFSIVFSLFF